MEQWLQVKQLLFCPCPSSHSSSWGKSRRALKALLVSALLGSLPSLTAQLPQVPHCFWSHCDLPQTVKSALCPVCASRMVRETLVLKAGSGQPSIHGTELRVFTPRAHYLCYRDGTLLLAGFALFCISFKTPESHTACKLGVLRQEQLKTEFLLEWLWHMIYLLLLCSASYNLQIFESIEISSILRPGLNQQKSWKRKRRLKNDYNGNKFTVSTGSRIFSYSKSCTRRRHLYFPNAYLKDLKV